MQASKINATGEREGVQDLQEAPAMREEVQDLGTTAAPVGRLWWSADSAAEAATWARECIERGAVAVTIKAGATAGHCDVIIAIRQDDIAANVAGHPIEADEWLEPLNRARIRALCADIQRLEREGLSSLDAPLLDKVQELADLAEDIGILAEDTETGTGNVLPVVWLPRAAAHAAEGFLAGFEDDTDTGNAEIIAGPLQALRAALATSAG